MGWGDWLGTGTLAPRNRTFLPFAEARAYARSLNLKSGTEWNAWTKSGAEWLAWTTSGARPHDIPTNPDTVYKSQGWVSWGDWLGTGTVASHRRTFLPFDASPRPCALPQPEDRRRSGTRGRRPAPGPDDIPTNPDRTYKNKGWVELGRLAPRR